MADYIAKNKNFCKDTESVSKKEHGGQMCWRQITKDGRGAGLHFCFGAGKPSEVHIDHNQVSLGRIPFTETCLYDPIALYKHYKDLKSSAPKTVFDVLGEEDADLKRMLQESENSCTGFDKYLFKLNIEKMQAQVTKDKIMAIAGLGESGPNAENALLKKSWTKNSSYSVLPLAHVDDANS
ncbi:MAG TPA: hypothetical protein VNJ08_10950 [Bacteriovoracaceae bacterium]|nr:hypothetical protein [Bacteriovoracaceae bacterium]